MSLFYRYDESGSGISKKAPVKKPFFRFWEIFASKFWKLIILNMIYFVSIIPVVTFGPATAALAHVMRKFVLGQPIFVAHEYWKAFKKNFKQSFFMGIFDLLFIVAFVYLYVYCDKAIFGGDETIYFVFMAMCICVATIFLMMNFYIYLEIVALKLSMRAIVKNSMLLVVLGIKKNVFTVFFILLFGFVFYLLFPYSVLVLPIMPLSWMALIIVFNSYPVIQKTIVIPYYESRGEKNPEIPDGDESDKAIFVDKGGEEAEIVRKASKVRAHGKVIK